MANDMYVPDQFRKTLEGRVITAKSMSQYLVRGGILDTSRLDDDHQKKDLYHSAELELVAGFDRPIAEAWLEYSLQEAGRERAAIQSQRDSRTGIHKLANLKTAPVVEDPELDDFRRLSYADLRNFIYEQGGDPTEKEYFTGLLKEGSARAKGVRLFETRVYSITGDYGTPDDTAVDKVENVPQPTSPESQGTTRAFSKADVDLELARKTGHVHAAVPVPEDLLTTRVYDPAAGQRQTAGIGTPEAQNPWVETGNTTRTNDPGAGAAYVAPPPPLAGMPQGTQAHAPAVGPVASLSQLSRDQYDARTPTQPTMAAELGDHTPDRSDVAFQPTEAHDLGELEVELARRDYTESLPTPVATVPQGAEVGDYDEQAFTVVGDGGGPSQEDVANLRKLFKEAGLDKKDK
jgi:hypothetical protein